MVSHFPTKNSVPNYVDVQIGNLDILLKKKESFISLQTIEIDRIAMYQAQLTAVPFGHTACELTFQSNSFQNFLNEKQQFDLFIFDDFYSECFWPLAQIYSCPVIRLLSHNLASWNGKSMGNPLGSAYLPNLFLLQNNKDSFFGRLERSILNLLHNLYFDYSVVPIQKKIAKKYLSVDETIFDNSFFNESLLLLNYHHVMGVSRPLVPNIIEVGGIHLKDSQILPKDIEQWINGSEHGVIYFSLGSVIKGHTIPTEKKKAFLNAFKRLPQRVIWKWENDTMEGKTDNILIGKWMPQFDILSHPNVKAFISHGGLLGTMEAVHCGVPVMVMPQFGDQHTNAKALESVGGGVILYMNDANEETIYQSLKKILEPKFQAQAKELSERFRDRPMPPLETAIYWVEYVARHKGAHFMKTAAVNMPFYQYYLLDVIAFLVVVSSIIFYSVYISLKFLLKKVTSLFKKPVTPMKHKKS